MAALGGAALAFWLTHPKTFDPTTFDTIVGDAQAGELVFTASGCASCHAAPDSDNKLVLAGGTAFASDFGTFFAPNISPDTEFGIGTWSVADLANAVIHGTSPQGSHYYPAFPYGSYNGMRLQDVADLHSYMMTLEASQTPSKPHDVGFPFNIRRSLGGWKLLFVSTDPVVQEDSRGRYLVETLGHCAECHTPRNMLGGLQRGLWLAGAPNPDGPGRVPNITPHADGIGAWSVEEIAEYLSSGFTPEFDSVGGAMVDVVENLSKLPEADRMAIAKYLKAIEAKPND